MDNTKTGILARYLGREAAGLALSARPKGGAVRPACVLFADMRHFSRLAESVDLRTLADFVGEFMGLFVEIVEAQGGMVNKFLGDGALALFRDALPAARAGLALHDAFLRFAGRWSGNNPGVAAFARLDLAVGLNHGEIFLGNVGGPGRFDFTALGAPVNIAERLAMRAPNATEGGVLCSAAVQARLAAEPEILAEPLGAVRPHGMSAEVLVFRLRLSGCGAP